MENDAIHSDVSAGGENPEAELANMFGDEAESPVENSQQVEHEDELVIDPDGDDDPEENDEEDGEDEPTYEIKVNGKTEKVNQKRLIEMAQLSEGSRQKFEEAAAMRKEAEALKQALPERQKQLEVVLEHYIKATQAAMPQEPDWRALLDADIRNGTRNFDVAKFNWEQKQRELTMAQQAKAEMEKASEAERSAANQQRLKDEIEKVREVIPAWKDPKRAAEEAQAIGKYLETSGIPQEMIGTIDDHRVLLLARKAMLYDQAVSRRTQAQQAPRQASTVERPTVSQQATPKVAVRREKAQKAFRENPSVDTLSNFFMN